MAGMCEKHCAHTIEPQADTGGSSALWQGIVGTTADGNGCKGSLLPP